MNLYTLCLSLCFLLVSLNPSIPMQAIFGRNPSGYGFDLSRFLKAVNAYYVIMFLGIGLLYPRFIQFHGQVSFAYLPLAILLMIGMFLLEVSFSHGLRCLKAQKWLPLKLSFVGAASRPIDVVLTLSLAFFEEMTYRLLWFDILLQKWELPFILVLLITTIFYALNHLLMGKEILYAKLLTGLLYGMIYYWSGNIWLVLFIHIGGNLWIDCLNIYQAKKRGAL